MKTITKTWINFGDINPREYGGIFVRNVDGEIEVIETRNLEEECGLQGQYRIQEYSITENEAQELWDNFLLGDNSVDPVASYADWDTLRDADNDIRLARIAIDMLSYYGPNCDYPEIVTNYWQSLRQYGIYPRHS